MATTTTNLSLSKPAATDTTVIRTDYNTMLDAVDAAVAARVTTARVDAWLPTGILAQSFDAWEVRTDNLTIMSSGRQYLTGLYIPTGTVVSALTIGSATTAIGTPTNQWQALYGADRSKLAVTADDGATAWAAATYKTLYVSRIITDAAITSSTATLTSEAANFTAADVGKNVTIMGAGAAGVPLGTTAARVTILSVEAENSVTLSANAATTVAAATGYIATPYTTTTAGRFYHGLVTVAGTPPSIMGVTGISAAPNSAHVPARAGTSNTGLTIPSTAPSTPTIAGFPALPHVYVT